MKFIWAHEVQECLTWPLSTMSQHTCLKSSFNRLWESKQRLFNKTSSLVIYLAGPCHPNPLQPSFEPKTVFVNKMADVWMLTEDLCAPNKTILQHQIFIVICDQQCIHCHWSVWKMQLPVTQTWSISGSSRNKSAGHGEQEQFAITWRKYMNFLEWSVKVKAVAPTWNWKQTQLLHKYDP